MANKSSRAGDKNFHWITTLKRTPALIKYTPDRGENSVY
jgi:hypothetical protein